MVSEFSSVIRLYLIPIPPIIISNINTFVQEAIVSGYTQKLGDLQKKILKHMISCNEDVETVSHISREVGALQPDVFRSTKKMIDDGILDKKATSKSNRMELVLTDKGIAIALLVGIKNERLENYFSRSTDYKSDYDRERHKFFDIIIQQTKDTTKQQTLLKKALEYMLEHGWYDQENKILNLQDKMYLVLNLAPLVGTDTIDLKDYFELSNRFGLPENTIGIMVMKGFYDALSVLTRCGNYQDQPRVLASGGDFKGLLRNLAVLISDIRKAVDVKAVQMSNKRFLADFASATSISEEEVKRLLNDEIKFAKEVFEIIKKVLTESEVINNTKSLPKKKKPT